MPHLQVPQVIDAERPGLRPVLGRCIPPGQQLAVPRVRVDHVLALGVEEVLQDEVDVAAVEVDGRLQAQLQETVAGAPLGKGLELHEQRRHQVEGHPNVRELAQQRHHAVVVLQRVQADPRQDVLAGRQVLVIRLVHVPQDGDAGHTL